MNLGGHDDGPGGKPESEVGETGYLNAVRRVPRPTDGQCRSFARGMAQRHSWYKHLPIHPSVPFRFFAGPLAQRLSDWGNQLMDRSQVFVTTEEEHLEHYGCWTCNAPFHMYQGLMSEHVAEVRCGTGWWVAGPGERRLLVPDDLVALGTVEVNAFVHPKAQRLFTGIWFGEQEVEAYGGPAYLEALGHPVSPGTARYQAREHFEAVVTAEHVAEVRERTLDRMVEAMHAIRARIWDDPT